jgi:hypothetical protein
MNDALWTILYLILIWVTIKNCIWLYKLRQDPDNIFRKAKICRLCNKLVHFWQRKNNPLTEDAKWDWYPIYRWHKRCVNQLPFKIGDKVIVTSADRDNLKHVTDWYRLQTNCEPIGTIVELKMLWPEFYRVELEGDTKLTQVVGAGYSSSFTSIYVWVSPDEIEFVNGFHRILGEIDESIN